MINKEFWKTVRPFISHKTNTNDCQITLSENNVVVKDRSDVADILNEYFINIAEYTVGRRTPALQRSDIESSISEIINKYEHHISIKNIKKKRINSSFGFEETTYSKIRQLLTELNPDKPIRVATFQII